MMNPVQPLSKTCTAPPPNTSARHAALYQACQQFEATFILQLWRAMQRTLPRHTQTLNYTEMFDFQFADYLAKYGQFGIAEQLYQQLSRHLAGGSDENLR